MKKDKRVKVKIIEALNKALKERLNPPLFELQNKKGDTK